MTRPVDTLNVTEDSQGFAPNWDYKNSYVSQLKDDGLERFSQLSATPDTTAIYAGPARFAGIGDGSATLLPIGLVDGFNFGSSTQLARLYEIGSNRAFFTRGKTMHQVSFGKMLADQANIIATLTRNAHTYHGLDLNIDGTKAPGPDGADSQIMMNLDSEYTNVPFGMLLVFKTKGSPGNPRGKILSAVYLEYCMLSGYNFSINAQSPVIQESVSVEYDRPVPVAIQ